MYCKYSLPFRDQILNHNGLTEVPDYKFDAEGNVISFNPRLKDPVRNIRTRLDRPSMTGSLPLSRIYDAPILDNYTPHNVNNGQITYYIDNSIKDPYYRPVYDLPSMTVSYAYTDPMTSEKPHYSLVHPNQSIYGYSPLSSINDSTFHRENLIASQQAKYNQTRITPFY
jgi:hypothetical protein